MTWRYQIFIHTDEVLAWLDADSIQELHALQASLAGLADDRMFESEFRVRRPTMHGAGLRCVARCSPAIY